MGLSNSTNRRISALEARLAKLEAICSVPQITTTEKSNEKNKFPSRRYSLEIYGVAPMDILTEEELNATYALMPSSPRGTISTCTDNSTNGSRIKTKSGDSVHEIVSANGSRIRTKSNDLGNTSKNGSKIKKPRSR